MLAGSAAGTDATATCAAATRAAAGCLVADLSTPSAAIGSAAGAAGALCSAIIASGALVLGGAITNGAASAAALSNSITTVLRSLRTRCETGCASATRTRDAGRPSDSAASIDTPAIGLFELATTELATEPAPTLRKSSSSVSGSGRVAVYATGSLASMTSDAPLAPTLELIAVSRTLSGGGALGPEALTSVPAVATMEIRATARVRVITWRPR